jgi:hypothetical protein
LLHYLVGGSWGFVIRRPLEAASMTLPLSAVLFLPIALWVHTLYPEWTDAEAVLRSPELLHKSVYLNIPFFIARALFYHALWSGLALLVHRGSRAQDETESPAPTERVQALAAPGLIVLFFSVTFAMIDWMMSIEPEWYSSIYGVMVFVGMGLGSLALAIVVSSLLAHVRPLADVARPDGFHDLGNLLLAFTMLWAYMSFSQYLVIWSGNLAEEVPWYLKRSAGGWRTVCMGLMLFQFFVPFFCLLSRENKRVSSRLWRIAAAILVMQLVNDAWLLLPAYGYESARWTQAAQILSLVPAVLGVGGLWASVFAGQLQSRPLLPRHDPLLAAVLGHHAGGGH